MAEYKVFKELELPAEVNLEPHSIYLVAPAARPDYVEIYVTGASTSTIKRVIDQSDVQSMIDSDIAALAAIEVVADIAARDALTMEANTQVMVLDATADATVDSGAATYIYRESDTSFTKIAEYESLDVILNWNDIVGRPSSSVADIDDAVTKRHAHSNKAQLDLVTQDANGNMLYNGSLPVTAWDSVEW
jgi:D-alanyl-D-alanine dipeptidase